MVTIIKDLNNNKIMVTQFFQRPSILILNDSKYQRP